MFAAFSDPDRGAHPDSDIAIWVGQNNVAQWRTRGSSMENRGTPKLGGSIKAHLFGCTQKALHSHRFSAKAPGPGLTARTHHVGKYRNPNPKPTRARHKCTSKRRYRRERGLMNVLFLRSAIAPVGLTSCTLNRIRS